MTSTCSDVQTLDDALDECMSASRSSSGDQGQRDRSIAGVGSSSLANDGSSLEMKGGGQSQRQDGMDTVESSRPWSELKTKAGKERKRLPLACIVCRRKKIRCSGEKPACKHCFRSRIPCVYKVTTRKAAPRTDYMAMLDKRLKRMEERVIKIIPKDVVRDMAGIGRANVKPPAAGQTPRAPKAVNKKRSADEAFRAEMNEWMREGNGSASIDELPGSWQPRVGDAKKLFAEGAELLPSMEIQEHLAEVFFDCIYGQSYLLLHKPSFMRRLKAGAVPPVLILAVCAVSARFSTHPQISTEPAFLRGEDWAEAAARIALSRHDQPNITILTVFLILGLHEFGACHGGRSWSFGGQALRMAYALQLHQELNHDPFGSKSGHSELSFTDREIRRRTMWACILMDRYNSSGSQRPAIGNEKYLQIQLPIKESHFQMEIPGPTESLDGSVPNPVSEGVGQLTSPKDNMGASAYIIRGVILWGRIVDYLNLGGKQKDVHPLWSPQSGYANLKKQIEEFSASLPDSLAFTPENLRNHAAEKIANQFLFLHLVIHQNILFLNRFAIPLSPNERPPKDMPKAFLSDAGRAVVEAAGHISTLISQASGYLLTVPFAGYCAYAASTVHIWGIFSKNEQLEKRSKENLRHAYKYLNRMKQYWGMFHYMVESAKGLYRHFADAALMGLTSDTSGGNSSMFQYGDWFDKYPHGLSRMHWKDPNSDVKSEQGGDAVMGQQSDLRSVEEFFASLSPPSHADQARKEVKRRGPAAPEKQRHNTAAKSSKVRPETIDISPHAQSSHARPKPPSMIDTNSSSIPPHNPSHEFSPFPNSVAFSPIETPDFSSPAFKYPLRTDLAHLDRQHVYSGYTEVNSNSTTSLLNSVTTTNDNNHQHLLLHHPTAPSTNLAPELNHTDNNSSSSFWNIQLDMVGDGTGWAAGGNLLHPGAWFLPFNLDPGGGGGAAGFDVSAAATAASVDGNPLLGSSAVLDGCDLSLGVGDAAAAVGGGSGGIVGGGGATGSGQQMS
ncbi:hypothetical protein PRK78_000730 [Emydomyces testavorans]|uniref:Zn(2)-C6 fungal-type domain-containing protein n=1 Tax=Emydomyces testavorans TaxID=2070801 RepID=A0AAF0IG57_9EURO|nr:hypothetical protein PRK78_000730 [Emydomyces testavorans]